MNKRRGKKEETRVRQGPENRRDGREKGARAARPVRTEKGIRRARVSHVLEPRQER